MTSLEYQKWRAFFSRVSLLRYIPFIDFIFASGSLVTGEVHAHSDLDVLLGVREGRIFTVRLFSATILELLRWRRGKNDFGKAASDKICLNQFVTQKSYCLSSFYTEYEKSLYKRILPIYGNQELIQKFLDANSSWLGVRRHFALHARQLPRYQHWIIEFVEWMLLGFLGDAVESFAKKIQVPRIQRDSNGLRNRHAHVVCNDYELAFHPHMKEYQ